HDLIGAVQKGERRLDSDARAALAVVYGDQLVRACGWQWTRVVYQKGSDGWAGLVSPDRALGTFPSSLIEQQAQRGVKQNTIALSFNMLIEDVRPPRAKKAGYLQVS